ncbi:chorismate mutase [Paracoccus caeni]|uniref:chorismate mutase n=1 Tax=Paracoccus caeni TaxID=657651 RepID=A0A934VZ05_9RHOB|nr:chorismate mutase [Paracoccus caeni]MBK4214788.1 chorismate mutase [Paracoccus caeni]
MTRTEDIHDMTTLRAHIDALDQKVITLLAERSTLIARAAQIKSNIGLPARIEDRVEEVVANAGSHAASLGLDRALIENIWRQLVEAAIAQEDRHLKGDRP